MARTSRNPTMDPGLIFGQITEDQATRPVPHLANCKGINRSITPEQMGPDDAAQLENFFLNSAGKLQIRGGTLKLGSTASADISQVATYQRGDKTTYLVRWLTTTVEYFYNGVWTAFTGAALPFSSTSRITYAAWGSNVLLFAGASKVWAADFVAFTVTEVAASPASSASVYVFGNRAIICSPGTNYTRVQWSIKNDYTDWSSAGSGFEDMIPGPAGAGDAVLGGFPVSDTETLIIRNNSVWMQTITGNVDAPFNFNFLYRVSIRDINSAALAVGGVYILGNSDIYFLTPNGPKSIGDPLSGKYVLDISNAYSNAITGTAGAYDEYRKCYYLYAPLAASFTTSEILVYHERNGGWTTFKYPLQVGRMCVLNNVKDYIVPNDYLTRGPILSTLDKRVIYEDPSTTTDVNDSGTTTDLAAIALMAALKSITWGRRVRLESITIDTDGGTQSITNVTMTAFAPSRFDDVSLETINIAGTTAIQTSRLRQRRTFFSVIERNGLVPMVTFYASPMVSLNSVDINLSDGAPFISPTESITKDRMTVSLTARSTVASGDRFTV